MRVLVCGTRQRMSEDEQAWLYNRLKELKPSVIIEGGTTGVDNMAARYARALCVPNETFRPDWNRYGKGAGPRRNQAMLDSGVDFVVALPGPRSRGTWDMVRRARKAGVTVEIHHCR